MNTKVSAGPYTLEIPPNGVAVLYENGRRLPGGIGYLEALIQFAGEVIRLQAMLESVNQASAEEPQPMMDIPPEGWKPLASKTIAKTLVFLSDHMGKTPA